MQGPESDYYSDSVSDDDYMSDSDDVSMPPLSDRDVLFRATSTVLSTMGREARWVEERMQLARMRVHLVDTGFSGTTPQTYREAVAILVDRVRNPPRPQPTREQLVQIALEMTFNPEAIHPHINFASLTPAHIMHLDDLVSDIIEDLGEDAPEAAQPHALPSNFIVWVAPPPGYEHLANRPISIFASAAYRVRAGIPLTVPLTVPATVSATVPAAVPTAVPAAYQAYLAGEAVADLPPPVSPFEDRQPSQPRGIDALRDGDEPLYASPTADVGFDGEDTEHIE